MASDDLCFIFMLISLLSVASIFIFSKFLSGKQCKIKYSGNGWLVSSYGSKSFSYSFRGYLLLNNEAFDFLLRVT